MLRTCETIWARICHFTLNIRHYSTQCLSYNEFWKVCVEKTLNKRSQLYLKTCLFFIVAYAVFKPEGIKNSRPITRWKQCFTFISCFFQTYGQLLLLLLNAGLRIVPFGPVPGNSTTIHTTGGRQNPENHPWLLPLNSSSKLSFRYPEFTSLTSLYGIHLFPIPRLPLKSKPPQHTHPPGDLLFSFQHPC